MTTRYYIYSRAIVKCLPVCLINNDCKIIRYTSPPLKTVYTSNCINGSFGVSFRVSCVALKVQHTTFNMSCSGFRTYVVYKHNYYTGYYVYPKCGWVIQLIRQCVRLLYIISIYWGLLLTMTSLRSPRTITLMFLELLVCFYNLDHKHGAFDQESIAMGVVSKNGREISKY